MKRVYKSKTLGVLIVAGLALLASSFIARDDSWASGVLIDAGVTILLFAPLLFIGYRIELRLGEVQEGQTQASRRQSQLEAQQESMQEEISEAKEEIRLTREELSEAVVAKLAKTRDQDSSLFSGIADNPTAGNLHQALQRAKNLGLIAETGCRVILFDTALYVRFRPIDMKHELPDTLNVLLEHADGERLAVLPWKFGEDALEMLTKLGEHVVRSGNYPGDIAFDSARIFSDLQELLELAHVRSTGARGLREPLGKLVQLCPPQWAITDRAVVCTDRHREYSILASRFGELDWDDHMRSKPWVDIGSFRMALDVGMALYNSRRLAVKPVEPPPF